MASDKMLIDATHPEETRVVVLRNNRVEEFDYESAAKKLLRGNIYLAKVTRVEPSLQAAFVDYGGNRHGFLAFNEIHPDYYQIPVADRQALLEAEAEAAAQAEAEAEAAEEAERRRREAQGITTADDDADDAEADDDEESERIDETGGSTASWADEEMGEGRSVPERRDDPADSDAVSAQAEPPNEPYRVRAEQAVSDDDARISAPMSDALAGNDETVFGTSDQPNEAFDADSSADDRATDQPDMGSRDNGRHQHGRHESGRNGADHAQDAEPVESVGSEDALEEVPQRRPRRMRSYKIQEVIRRRQIMLVQVVKEERGNKGAALTTYLSLAGRYTVLMPNTGRGGGISRKITNAADRKRLKEIATELEIPDGMGLIVRTAGAARSKAEVKRDFEYLLRLWENVRDLTLESTAPALVYEEGNLIKRSIRDLYSKEISKVIVAGDGAYRDAKDFMRMIMPSHAANVVPYQSAEPLFVHYQIERQLNAMYSPTVTLKSGGYIVLNQTEALVAIDVNSGRSTREHSIEDTALATNMEACDEIARQLRLRDLAGLIVIDFIDMEERRNNRNVERRLKDALKNDRARIQVGRISHFGLMEMSRQRLRTGIVEGSTSQCPHCQGSGVIRSVESVALAILRSLEDTLAAGRRRDLTAMCSVEGALYLLNHKRDYLRDIEERHGIKVTVAADPTMHGATFRIDIGEERHDPKPMRSISSINAVAEAEIETVNSAADDSLSAEQFDEDEADSNRLEGDEEERVNGSSRDESEDGDRRGGRRRRRRRGRTDRPNAVVAENGDRVQSNGGEVVQVDAANGTDDDDTEGEDGVEAREGEDGEGGAGRDGERGRRRRRGRRGGRRHRGDAPRPGELAGAEGAVANDTISGSAEPGQMVPAMLPVEAGFDDHGAAPAAMMTEEAAMPPQIIEPWLADASAPSVTWEPSPSAHWDTESVQTLQPWTSDVIIAQPEPPAPVDVVAEVDHGALVNGQSDSIESDHQPSLTQSSVEPEIAPEPAPLPPPELPALQGPPRKGWWQRRFS